MKLRTIFLFLIFLCIYVLVLAQQEETLTITTYYPSPAGVYRELTTDNLTVNQRTDTYFLHVKDSRTYLEGLDGANFHWINVRGSEMLGFRGDGLVQINGNLYVTGNLNVSGSKNAVVNTSYSSQTKLYSLESPSAWFEDFGSAQLKNGSITIQLDPIFLEVISKEKPFVVFITPTSPGSSLYIAHQDKRSFTVKDNNNSKSKATFYWRVVGRRKNFENVRFNDVETKESWLIPKEDSNKG